MPRKYRAVLKSLSGLCLNLSAGWFGVVFFVPNVVEISKIDSSNLTYDISFGILCLVISIIIEYYLDYE